MHACIVYLHTSHNVCIFLSHLLSKPLILRGCYIAGVMKQVDQALAREEYERLKRILHKEIKSIEEDIK